MKTGCLLLLILVPLCSSAEEWQFTKPVIVTETKENVFHHLDASSRRAIAVSNNTIAIVWEDNRSGTPHIYVAVTKVSESVFQKPIKVSQAGPAYEPGIVALNDGRFVIGWEAENHVWLRVLKDHDLGEISALTQNRSRQIALDVTADNRLVAVWAEQINKR